jgi:Protein of unknown function (DUF3584)
MNYLNKIIFINSASIKYAEINLDGHIHLIGNQGVGKSTVLRALLFFYNADSTKLGILVGKKSYAEYYFQYFDSYIVYEVARAEGNYCVISYKKNQRVMFRFVDAPYSKDFFMDETGQVPTDWKGISTRLDAQKVTFSISEIDSYIEYRNILYGAVPEKEQNKWKKYFLLKSEAYQNIPKTIQNIFLNAKVDGNFIKQTMIASLEGENPMLNIRLDNYRVHLKDFNEQRKDIRQFRAEETTMLAAKIKKNYLSILLLAQDKITLAKEFIWASAALDKDEPLLNANFQQGELEEKNIVKKLETLLSEFSTMQLNLKTQIEMQKSVLKQIDDKKKDYETQNIQSVLEKVQRKQELLLRQKEQALMHDRLTKNYDSITDQYGLLLQDAENAWKSYENEKKGLKNELETAFLKFQGEEQDALNHLIANLKATHQTERILFESELEHKQLIINQLNDRKSDIQYKPFFKYEISNHKTEEQNEKELMQAAERNHKDALKAVTQLTGELSTQERHLQRIFNLDKQELDKSLKSAEKEVSDIRKKIQNSENSLYGWLTENYPNWENTIGKVILDNDAVLFNPNLSPRFTTPPLPMSFYGIELDLNAIKQRVKTVADYEVEKLGFEKTIHEKLKDIKNLESKFYDDKEALDKEYRRKIKKEQGLIESKVYEQLQAEQKMKASKLAWQNLEKQGEIQQKEAMEKVQSDLDDAMLQKKWAMDKLQEKDKNHTAQVRQCEVETKAKITTERQVKTENIQKINELINNENIRYKQRNNDFKAEMDRALTDAGVDTERLNGIVKQLKTLQNGLDYIEKHQSLVTWYERDKLELFDKRSDFERALHNLKTHLEQVKKQFEGDKIFLNKDLDSIRDNNLKIKEALKQIETDRRAVRQFKLADVYKSLQDLFQSPTEAVETLRNCNELMDNLYKKHHEWKTQLDELKKNIRAFSDPFTENNILKFKKNLNSDDANAFFQFAASLIFFIEEQKIEYYETLFNEKFADIVKNIGREMKDLAAQEEALKKITQKINKDFENKDFAFVIKEIKLEIQDNDADEIVTMLKAIRKFNDEHITPFSNNNLFSDEKTNKNIEKAIRLVEKFIEKLGKDNREEIVLSDCFKLFFRIKENDNDTGKIDNLSNVGSAGTDVIVKALLNIGLLNVFKEDASKKAKTFQLHCMMDEIGMLHPTNIRGILKFAADRNIFLINGSPIATDVEAYKHVYILEKDSRNITKVKKLLTHKG